MDTTGFNQVGRYGTLSLLKRQSVPAATSGELNGNGKPKDAASSPPAQVITSFGIDSANLTFGSSLQCDVRLYYPTVDAVHCRLINEDGKAFLVVQGKAGAFVDGSWVYPSTSSSSSSSSNASEEAQQTIIPLANNAEFEIHSKRFQFAYPPKEQRKVLLATPVAQRNRTLRLSMIQSAQVFTPRPSKDPRENLRILQSPIKTSIFGVGSTLDGNDRDRSTSPNKPRAVSPLKFGVGPDDDSSDEDTDDREEQDQNNTEGDDALEEEEHIVLVHTNHPRVVEEDRDLVILEDVPLHLVLPSPSVYAAGSPTKAVRTVPPGTPTPILAQPTPQLVQPQPPRTPPRRKSLGGTALHRAVLIRSAQRAVWRAEKEREEEEEEMEVLDAVVAPGGKQDGDDLDMDEDDSSEDEHEQEDVEMRSVSDDSDSLGMDSDSGEERGDDDGEINEKEGDKPLWKKIIPWPFGAKKEEEEEDKEEQAQQDNNADEEDDPEQVENDEVSSLPILLPKPQHQQTPIRRVLGSFMTPQARHPVQQQTSTTASDTSRASEASGPTSTAAPVLAPVAAPAPRPGRYSLGGGEARRVLVQQPWRVKDLVVPPIVAPATSLSSTAMRAMDPPSTSGDGPFGASSADASTSRATSARPSITAEERKAIQERRRSAVREVREDSFWKDGAPGMSPSKSRPSFGTGAGSSPIKAPPGLGLGRPSSSGISTTATPRRGVLGSPTKGRSLGYAIPEAADDGHSIFLDKSSDSSSDNKDDDDGETTTGLFERMRETVEDMKRRRSIVSTPRATLLDGEGKAGDPAPGSAWRESVLRDSVKKLDFTKITPAQSKQTSGSLAGPSFSAAAAEVEATLTARTHAESSIFSKMIEEREETEVNAKADESEPFSLLRPGARALLSPSPAKRNEPGPTSDAVKVKKEKQEEVDIVMQNVPDVIIENVEEDAQSPAISEEPEETEPETKTRGRTRGRPRLLRAPKALEEATDQQVEDGSEQEINESKSKSSTKPPSRSKPPSKTRSRAGKSKSPAPVPSPQSLEAEPSGSGPRRHRSRTPQPRNANNDDLEPTPEEDSEQVPIRSTGKRTTRKGTVEPEEPTARRTTRRGTAEPEEPAPAKRATRRGTAEPEEAAVVAAPKRKSRKAGPEAEGEQDVEAEIEVEEEVVEKVKPTPKRGRKPRVVATPVADAIEEEDEVEDVPAPPPTAKRGRSKKVVEPAVVAPKQTAQEDEDEFDSYEVSTPAGAPVVATTAAKKASKNPGPIPAPTRRKKATEVDAVATQEPVLDDEESEEPVPLAATRGGRGARANTLKTPATSETRKARTPASNTTTTNNAGAAGTANRLRGRTKTPASAPATATTSASAGDTAEKENARTGGAGSGSADASDEELAVTKVRVSRKTVAATTAGSGRATKASAGKSSSRSKPKVDQTDDDELGIETTVGATGRPKATRIMRTRTKTG